jgi:YD repeat-containing protein
MVAIVAGNNFGIARSSAATLGAGGQLGSAAMGRGNDRVYVNAATGNLVIDRTDEMLIGHGPDAAYSLTYNSQDARTLAGTAMAWNLGTYHRITDITGTVNTAGSTAKRVAADGSTSLFTYDSAKGYYVSQDGPGGAAELRFAGGAWTWTAGQSRMTERYENVTGDYLLTSASDADGNSQSYTYNAGGLMTRITEANGDYTAISWTGGRPDAVTTSYTNASGLHTLTRVRYVFDSLYRLTSATVDLSPEDNAVGDGHSYTTTYGYDGSSLRVAWIAQTDGSRLDIGYTQSGSSYYATSLTETVASGVTRVTGLYYDLVSRVTTITDPLGGVTTMTYDAAGNLTRLVRPAPAPGVAGAATDYEYNATGDVVSLTENGLTTAFQYDANGNLKLIRDGAGNTVTRTYGSRNELLTETHWLGADPDGAGAAPATLPATKRYAYDPENHLRFTISAEGRVTEYQYNAPGQVISTIAYAGSTYILTGMAPDAPLSEAALQGWAASVDRSNAERTDTTYDARGNVNTVTRYNSLDAAGAGVASAGYRQDTFVYDQTGLLLSRSSNASSAQEIFFYDGLGRLVSSTDMTNRTITTAFNDAASKTTISYANGLTVVSVYDKAGGLISTSRSGPDVATATATATYDGLGRVRVETDATNRSTYHVYDAASRKVADVSADGAVTEYGYDASDRLVRKIEYLTKLDSSAIALLSGSGAGGGGGTGKGGVRGPSGLNLVQNGSFDQSGPGYTDLGNGERYGAELPGWLKSNPEFFEQVASGALGVSASDGGYWLDLDSTSQLGLAPTGGNLLVNAGFESFGVDNQSLPNWTKLNAQPFQQLASGSFGITASEGGFWLDLDSTMQTGTVTTGSNLIANGSFDTLGADNQSLPNWTKLNPQPYQQMTSGTGGIAASNGTYWLDLDSTMQTGWTTVGSEWLVNGSFETAASDQDMTGWVKVNPEGYQRLPSGTGGIAATNGSYWLDLDSTRQTGTIAVGGNLVNNGSFETAGATDQSMPGWVKFNPQPFQQMVSGTGGVAATNGTYWLDLDSKYQSGWAGTGSNWLVNGSFEQMGSSDQQMPGWTKANSEYFQQFTSGTEGVVSTDGSRWLDLDSAIRTGYSTIGGNVASNGSFESSGGSYATTSNGRLGATLTSWTSNNNALLEQVTSGLMGVTATAGSYWLDLDAPTRVAVGNNLLTNGSFEQVTGNTAVISGGRSAAAIPGWTKNITSSFEMMTSGTGGVTATDGSYWLDLDVAKGVPQGQDILVNGSFEQVNGTGTPTANGTLYTSMPGWTISNSQGVERVPSGTFGMAAADGTYFLDMDGQAGSASNADISQTVNLTASQQFTISLSYANTAGMVEGVEGPENSGALWVYWNGNVVGSIGPHEAAFGTKTFTVSGVVGNNTLRLREMGVQDGRGVSLDNVKLIAGATQSAANLKLSQTVTGLTAGQIMQLSFDHANRGAVGTGSFYVTWNGLVVGSYDDATATMQTTTMFVTAAAGNNVLEFAGMGTADNIGASLDNVRLFATQAAAPTNVDIEQKIHIGSAGLEYRIQFDHANRTTAASGSFEVLWNGTVVANVTDGVAAMQTKTLFVNSVAGYNVLRFRGTGTADDAGASLDNIRATWVIPTYTPGNMDVSQAVTGLTAGQKMELSFDHANRTTSASGSFDVLWNGQVIDSISSTGTTMQRKTYYLTAVGGTDVVQFRGTGTANDVGASIDNVRLLTAQPVYSTGNMDVSQTVQNLTAGQSMQLKFDYANRTAATSGSFQVLWNGVVIDTVTDGTVAMKPRTYTVTAIAGDNVIGFRGTGTVDDVGASIDNVQLYATQPVMTPGNMHIKQTVNGLIAGQMMQLQFDYANRTGAASGSFEVLWNGAVLATVSDGTTTMQTRTVQGTVAGGSGVLEFRGTGTADDVGASIDNVRLMTLQPVYAPGNMDISQTVANLSANQALQLQFEYASRAAAGSGIFEVLWNGNVVATVTDGTMTMQTRTIALTALAGNNILRFRGTGTADDVGASLDNVRLMATQPVYTPGNMIVSQSVTGLNAGQTLQLDFDYANRTGTSSGTFEVLWNGTVVDTVVDGNSVMKTKTLALTAMAGTNMLGFRGAGAADDAGASLDNVRLRLTQPISAPGNMAISQTINNLAAGQQLQLLFDHANRTGSASGGFDVYWNGTRLGQITDLSSTMHTSSYAVTAVAGANLLEFRGTGAADEAGASLDNVRLLAMSGTPPVAPSPTDPLAGLRPAPAIDGDVWTWNVYDSADRLVETIDSAGRAVTFTYDGDSRLIGTKAYANALGAGILAGFKTSPPTVPVLPSPDATTDRPTRSFYDADGRVIGSLDGVGGFSRIYYDAAGRKVREVGYANPVASQTWAGGTFADLVASVGTHAADRRVDYVYDDRGLLRFIIDAAGRPTEMVYDTAGAVVRTIALAGSIAAPAGGADYTLAHVQGQLAATGLSSDGANRITRAVYDTAGRTAFTIDAEGGVCGYFYDQFGNLLKETRHSAIFTAAGDQSLSAMQGWAAAHSNDLGNRVTRQVVDAAGRAAYTVDAEGYVTEQRFDLAGRPTQTIRYPSPYSVPDGATMASVAAQIGGLPAGAVVTGYAYDPVGRLVDLTDAENVVTHYVYDALGQVTDETLAYGTTEAVTLHRNYDAAGRVSSETRAYGTPDAATTSYGYDALGNLLTVTDARNSTTVRGYDALGNIVSMTSPIDASTNALATWAYDRFGNVVKSTDARGNSSYDYYDRLGRLVASRDAENYVTETAYNVFGEVSSVTRRYNRANNAADPAILPTYVAHAKDATTGFHYDRLGRSKLVTDAEGHSEEYWYDAFGQRITVRNKLGGFVHNSFDRRGQLVAETLPTVAHDKWGNVTAWSVTNRFEYDSRGNRKVMTEAHGLVEQRVTTYVYDKLDRLTEIHNPAVTALSQADQAGAGSVIPVEYRKYDRLGGLIETTDALGARTLLYYDRLHRQVAQLSQTSLNGPGTLSTSGYDANGNMVSSRVYGTQIGLPAAAGGAAPSAGGEYRETTHSYDSLNRLKTSSVANLRTGAWNDTYFAIGSGTVTTAFDYDANGNVIKATNGNNFSSFSYYDRANRKIASVDEESYLTAWTLDAEDNVTEETRLANKVTVAVSTATDPGALRNSVPPSGADRITHFVYDRNGRRTSETRLNVSAHALDGTGALVAGAAHSTIGYSYNGLGQVTQKTFANNDYITYNYDLAGRLTEEYRAPFTDLSGAWVRPTTLYSYDALDNLSVTRQVGGAAAADRYTRYTYGAGGRLAQMTDAAGNSYNYSYDAAGNVLRESYDRVKSDGTFVTEGLLYNRDALGRVTSQAIATWNGSFWARGDTQDTAYNAYGDVAQRGVNGGWQEQFAYDGAGRMWRSNSGDGVWRFFVHDGTGNQTLTLESEGGINLSGAAFESALAVATANGAYNVGVAYIDGINATINIFDQRGQARQTRMPKRQLNDSSAAIDLVVSRTYNAFGEVASETDARNFTTDYTYNTMGRLIQKQSPEVSYTPENGISSTARPTEYFYHDAAGRLIGARDANGNLVTRALLGGTGHGSTEALVAYEYHADGGYIRHDYDVHGDQRISWDEISRRTDMSYDAMGRVTQINRPNTLVENFTYDLLGQRISHWNNFLQVPIYGPPEQVWVTSGYWENNWEWVDTSHWEEHRPIVGYGPDKELTDYDLQGRVTRQVAFGGDTTLTTYSWNGGIGTDGLGVFGVWTETTTMANGRSTTESTDLFGHQVYRSDLGGHVYTFSYDLAGRMIQRAGTETLNYEWLNTGKVAQTFSATGVQGSENWSRKGTTYGYDKSGNLTSELLIDQGRSYSEWQDPYYGTQYFDHSWSNAAKNATATYDGLNRMATWAEAGSAQVAGASTTFQYDLAGNIRRSYSLYREVDAAGNPGGSDVAQDNWYRFDSMNRLVTKGSLVAGQIVRGANGGDYLYDQAGQRMSATTTALASAQLVNPYYDPYYGGNEYYYYDYEQDTREDYTYDAAGVLSTVRVAQSGYTDGGDGSTFTETALPAYAALRGKYTNDLLGRVTRQEDWLGDGSWVAYDRSVVFNNKGQVTNETVVNLQGYETITTVSTHDYGSGATYALGAVVLTTGTTTKGTVQQGASSTAYEYVWYEGALQSTISTTSTTYTPTYSSATHATTLTYDGSGALTSLYVGDGRPRSVTFVSDSNGQAIKRDESDNLAGGDPHEVWHRFGGKQMGYVGNNGTLDTDYAASINNRTIAEPTTNPGAFRFGQHSGGAHANFDLSGERITSYDQGGVAGGYTVRQGDTLETIAAQLWGDSSLWYKLAEANGLSASNGLAEGQRLTIPAGVIRNHHNASTFKPFDPSETLGDISPTTPSPQKTVAKRGGKCGTFGIILLVVIAVAVTVVTSGAALAALSPTVGGIGAGITAMATGMAGGVAVGAGSMIAAGAIGGVVGSIASQGFGVATGIQDKFSWKAVAMAGISGAVGGGLGSVMKGGGILMSAARGAAGSAISQGIGVTVGLQKKFDFAGVAAAGLAGGVTAGVGKALGAGSLTDLSVRNIGANLATSTAGAIANAAARSLINGSDFGDNMLAALPDIIGSTIGNMIGSAFADGGRGGGGSTASDGDGTTEPFEQSDSVSAPGAASDEAIWINQGALMDAAERAFNLGPLDISLPEFDFVSADPAVQFMLDRARLRAQLVHGGTPFGGDAAQAAGVSSSIVNIRPTSLNGDVVIAGGPSTGNLTLSGYINSLALDGLTSVLGRHFFDNNPNVYFGDPGAFRQRIAGETAHNDFMLRANIRNLTDAGDARFQPYIDALRAEVQQRWDNGGRERTAIADRAAWDIFTFGIQPLNTGTAAVRMFYYGEYNLQNGIAVGGAVLGPLGSVGSKIFSRAGAAADVVPQGVIYLRTDLSGSLSPYIGQARSLDRFVARQAEHARNNPFSDFEFSIVGRAEPGVSLDIAEHTALQGLTGGVRASRSSAVSNRIDPIGTQRRVRLGIPHPRN